MPKSPRSPGCIRNRLYYALCFALTASAAWVLRERHVAMLAAAMALLPALSWGAAAWGLRRLRVYVTTDAARETVTRGERVALRLDVENRSLFWLPHLRLLWHEHPGMAWEQPPDRLFAAGARARLSETVGVRFLRRGRYEVGCHTAEAYDCLRLFRLRRPVTAAEVPTVWVYPRVRPVAPEEALPPTGDAVRAARHTREREREEVADIRAYGVGDHPRDIHWKLSAKGEELMVRRYAAADRADVLVALDSQPTDAGEEAEDRLADAALSLAHHYLTQGKTVDFLYADAAAHVERLRSTAAFHGLLRTGALLRFDSAVPFAGTVGRYLETGRVCHRMYLLTASPQRALPRVPAGFAVTVVDGGAAAADTAWRRTLEARGGRYRRVEDVCGE